MPSPDQLEDAEDRGLILTLGYGGLIPFALLAALLWLVESGLQGFVATALATYAALIAAFLGGIHWGIGWNASVLGNVRHSGHLHAQRRHFLWGVMPSLLAWEINNRSNGSVFFRFPNLLDSITWFVSSVSSTSPAAIEAAAKTFALEPCSSSFCRNSNKLRGE